MEYLTLTAECGTIRVSISSGISFSSNPPGADIYLIASGSGIPPVNTGFHTPKTLSLPEGNYEYILKLRGFEDYADTAPVNPGFITDVTVNLTPKTVSIPALVAVGAISMLGIMLVTTGSAIPITTGILGGEVVAVKL